MRSIDLKLIPGDGIGVEVMIEARRVLDRLADLHGGVVFRYHDLLFDNQRALTRADLESYAQQLGLDMARFRQALDNHTHAATIDADQALAQQLGATGTPSIFVNGKLLRGAQPLSVFQTRVDAELIAARALLRRGVSRNQVYARTVRGGLNAPPPTP